ncbi:unnamed protein product [Acanthocheilonema viteae]|uniref:Uncharacterized protein n=1 Tax=Acanthocheilonema viteae TaxID=6277 RepID=A0A498SA59_ACAVI|nr:unnamed protein product [Acanthocheilonema viteae]
MYIFIPGLFGPIITKRSDRMNGNERGPKDDLPNGDCMMKEKIEEEGRRRKKEEEEEEEEEQEEQEEQEEEEEEEEGGDGKVFRE